MLRYTAILSNSLSYTSISAYLNIIRLIHLESGFPNPLEDYQLKALLKGTRRDLGHIVTPKLPITPSILIRIYPLLDMGAPLDLFFWASTLMGFFGMLRKANLFPSASDSIVTRSDFVKIDQGLVVTLHATKTIQYKERTHQVLLPYLKGSVLCPVSSILRAFSKFPVNQTAPAFSYMSLGRLISLTYSTYVARLRHFLTLIGLQPSKYAGHSLRRGGATWAFNCGARGEMVKAQGDWRSDAYLKYLELPPSSLSDIVKAMADGIQKLT